MFLGWFELLSTLRKKSNFPTFLVFFPKLYFSEREKEREREKLYFFVTFNIIMSHIFLENFFEIFQIFQKM